MEYSREKKGWLGVEWQYRARRIATPPIDPHSMWDVRSSLINSVSEEAMLSGLVYRGLANGRLWAPDWTLGRFGGSEMVSDWARLRTVHSYGVEDQVMRCGSSPICLFFQWHSNPSTSSIFSSWILTKNHLQFIWKHSCPRIAQKILPKNKDVTLLLADTKTYSSFS